MSDGDGIFLTGLIGGLFSGFMAGYGVGAWVFGNRKKPKPPTPANNEKD